MTHPPTLFDADHRAGVRIIATFPVLCSAEHIRMLPGLAGETDAALEDRLLCGAPALFYGRRDGRLLFWRNDVFAWWRRYCNGEAFNARSRDPLTTAPSGGSQWTGEFCDRAIFDDLVRDGAISVIARDAKADKG